ncbi:chemotaxis protein CheD [Pontibacillus litoralis]|uniref:Probable chemoreceptor glutamine deamidase CheD n=1 Tax=Pontibacillus litoralis JSM 072002 TaxID=1385512 RepID=A0A0A5G8P0_9BACI|nr:chemotaxis protein CheD [Pontibacillus litoralis]KGX88424.1 chemotaxis protein CheD [Pontibacillus litoralis JSM 072002]
MIDVSTVVKVGIADLNVVQSPQRIRTSGLGSCVGVVLFDEAKHVAGMVHVMLPNSSLAREKTLNTAKYADTGIGELLLKVQALGARKYAIKAKIAGGAQMFAFTSANEMMRIGPRNVESVKEQLQRYRIPLVAEDCGGNSGRTIEFDPTTALLEIRTVNKGVSQI